MANNQELFRHEVSCFPSITKLLASVMKATFAEAEAVFLVFCTPDDIKISWPLASLSSNAEKLSFHQELESVPITDTEESLKKASNPHTRAETISHQINSPE